MLGSSVEIVVRSGKPSDAAALQHLFKESWRCAYGGIIPSHHLEWMISKRTKKWWVSATRSRDCMLVLSLSGDTVGYATLGLSRTRGRVSPAEGEIYEIYLSPIHQGIGLGERLFEACRHTLEMRGHCGLIVWVLAQNTGAIEFYWRRGGRPVKSTTELIGGAPLEKIAFEWI